MKETVFLVRDGNIKKMMDDDLFNKSVNHKFLAKGIPFTTVKTIDMYEYLKPTLQDFNPGLFIIHVGTNTIL